MSLLKPLTDLQQGNRCLFAKDYERAVEYFLRHAQAHPQERATAYVQVAECCRRSNIIPQPQPIAPGVTLASASDRPSAEYYYRLALQSEPDHFGALGGLAEVLPEAADERLSILERAAALQPSCLILVALGDFYRSHRKDFSRAVRELSPRTGAESQRRNRLSSPE